MNTFGSSDKQFALCDPFQVRVNRQRFKRESVRALQRANSLYCPTGRQPSKGWLLLPRYEYVQLDTYNTALQLHIGDTTKADNVSVIKNLSIVQAQCVTTGLSTSANALYLIEVTDGRGVLKNKWFEFPIISSYNIRAPAYPQTFYPASLNGGTTWTWASMLEDIWTQMSSRLGAWPGLPQGYAAPAGTPEGFWMQGVSGLDALCDILDYLGLTIACDLTSNTTFTIVSDGADDTALTTLQTRFRTNLEDDSEWIDTGAGRVPASVTVLFKRRNSIYGTEETVTYSSNNPFQWSMDPLYQVTVAAPAAFSSAVGSHHLWSDFTVRFDHDNNPLPADVTTANQIAQERVTQYFDKIYSRTAGCMSQTYAGALPFATGSQVDGVCWYQNYRSDPRGGWRTHIVRTAYPPWPEIWDE